MITEIVTILIKLYGHLGSDQDTKHEHTEILRHMYIADVVVATIIILLFLYVLSIFMFI